MCRKTTYLIPIVLLLSLISGVGWADVLVDLRAKDLAYGTGVTTWHNRGSLSDFTAHGVPVVEDVDGRKAVTFDGSSWFEGPASTPSIEEAGSRTIEVWAYNPSIASEETMVSWARRGQPAGSNMAFNYGSSSTHGAVDHWSPGASPLNLGYTGTHSPAPAAGIWWHLVYTYDGETARIYVNAEEETTNSVGLLNTFGGYSIRIAAQGDNAGTGVQKALNFTGSLAKVRIYDRALTQEEIQLAMKGIALVATNPSPDDGATDVARDLVLSWTPGMHADKHDMYFGTNFNDVNDADRTNPLDVLVSQNQDANSYSPAELLQFDQTYYWRIDEVNAPPDFTLYKGEVWQFMAELFAPPVPSENITATASSSNSAAEGPENTVNGSGLDANDLHSVETVDMWITAPGDPGPAWIQYELDRIYKLYEMFVWNHNTSFESFVGFGLKDVTIEYSANGTDWTELASVPEFAQAPGVVGYAHNTTVDFGGAAAKYVRLTANSNWGGIMPQYGLSEVRFLQIPVNARKPYPDSGATGVDVDVVLGWNAGREAAKHDVYFSSDEQAVIDGTAGATTVAETSYGPLSLDLAKTYFWRVDEVNEAEIPNIWQGELWDFTTRQFLVVDDFESYNDLDPTDPESNRIFNVWIDGYQVPTNGSLVGYEAPPFCERTIVHSGSQSMPFFYSNTDGAASSEAELLLSPPQNWTKAGAATFVLYFHGTEGNTGQLYVKVDGSKVVYGGDAGDIAKAEWNQWNIDLASLGAGLQNITKLAIGIDGNGASGTLYFDDIRLYGSAP
ncbi:MAG: LamG-like jellyroll fold domain-containing protein [Planctomycetota bacterium]|jgi:hypothetical protein